MKLNMKRYDVLSFEDKVLLRCFEVGQNSPSVVTEETLSFTQCALKRYKTITGDDASG